MAQPSDITDVMTFLRSKAIAVISTISPEGLPEAATIYFTVDGKFQFYFLTKTFARKFKNISENPNVALVIGTESEPVTVQVEGVAQKITDQIEFNTQFENMTKIYSKLEYVAPMFQLSGGQHELVLYKITPNWMRFLDLRGAKSNGGFIQILP